MTLEVYSAESWRTCRALASDSEGSAAFIGWFRSGIRSDYSRRWIFLGVCALPITMWLAVLAIGIDTAELMAKLQFVAILLFYSLVYTVIGHRLARLRLPLAIAADLSLSVAQFSLILAFLLPLTYIAATTGFPLLDARLAQLDAMVGFDWDTAARWVAGRPVLDRLLTLAYNSMPFQAAAVLLIGSFKRPGDRNSEFMWLLMISLLVTCAIFAFTPALGKVGHVGTHYLDVLMQIRSGSWSIMQYKGAEGIVTFPSFHTSVAILLTYIVRHDRWALAVFAPLNIVMILSIPTVGGHYLVDLLGGAAVAWFSISVFRSVRRQLLHPAVPHCHEYRIWVDARNRRPCSSGQQRT